MWKDGSPVQIAYWADGEPNDGTSNKEGCVELYYTGKWNDLYCYSKRGYICKIAMGKLNCSVSF